MVGEEEHCASIQAKVSHPYWEPGYHVALLGESLVLTWRPKQEESEKRKCQSLVRDKFYLKNDSFEKQGSLVLTNKIDL